MKSVKAQSNRFLEFKMLLWTPHFSTWTPHFGWTPRLKQTLYIGKQTKCPTQTSLVCHGTA